VRLVDGFRWVIRSLLLSDDFLENWRMARGAKREVLGGLMFNDYDVVFSVLFLVVACCSCCFLSLLSFPLL
jgi:hypothetical protein